MITFIIFFICHFAIAIVMYAHENICVYEVQVESFLRDFIKMFYFNSLILQIACICIKLNQ